ncbi:hypothetical protein NQZ68_028803 [Dissostichus eleginoides]|nr:hypothetical protein NQZ68_028803 [Dissostichus eleginoides]
MLGTRAAETRSRMTLEEIAVSPEKDEERIELKSNLLACDRFKGSHTAERICEAVCDEYSIKNKIDYIISDNAANMRKAFTVCFPTEQENEDVDEEDDLDDPEL